MKRLQLVSILLTIIFVFASCTSGDDGDDFCETAVVSTLRVCIGENPAVCEYKVEYATVRPDGTYGEGTEIATNEATFEYYFEGKRNSFGVICWEGEK